MSLPLAPSTRIATVPIDSAKDTACLSPASVVTSQAAAAITASSTNAVPASSHRIHLRAGQGISELRREVDVKPRAAAGVRDGLRDVEPDAEERQAIAQPDADGVFERVAELVEGVAGVHEDGGDEALRQVAL